MIRRLIRRALQRLHDGPVCPACPHDQNVHGEAECLGTVEVTSPDGKWLGNRWCGCKRTYGKARPAAKAPAAAK